MKTQKIDEGREIRPEILKEAKKASKEMDAGNWFSQEEVESYLRQKKILEQEEFIPLEDTD